jgi:SAM-dependent methyltransferase
MMRLALEGKLHVAPIENMAGGLHNVLDIGTGTGIWAIEFGGLTSTLCLCLDICMLTGIIANTYRSASVIGTDLSPIQPELFVPSLPHLFHTNTPPRSVPSNCRFEIDDAEDDWLFPEPFDYIHGRALITCFKSHHTVFQHAFKSLRSGGYLEMQDADLPLRFIDDSGNGTALETWAQRIMDGGAALGKDFTRVRRFKEMFEEIGFVDVVETRTPLPIGTWAQGKVMKTLGEWMRIDMMVGLEAMSMAIMTRGLGMTPEEVEADLVKIKAEIESNKLHAYFPAYVSQPAMECSSY